MVNFGAKILNNAISGLQANQAQIAVTGNNITNANTAGYSRRTVELQTRLSRLSSGTTVDVGSGVEIGNIRRINDNFLDRALRGAIAGKEASSTEIKLIDRLQALFKLTGDTQTIGSTMSKFFTSVEDLALNPASIELRSNVIAAGEDLVTAIKTTYSAIAGLQTEADQQLTQEVLEVNSLAEQIASLNAAISQNEGTGKTAADERDRREILLQKLSEKMSFSIVEQSDGSVNIFLPSGTALVAGTTANTFEVTQAPTFGATPPPSLGGGILSYIVFNYGSSTTPAHVDLTQELAQGDGVIGGLLRVRGYNDPANTSPFQGDGVLVDIASRVEAISRALLTSVNQTYLGPDRNAGDPNYNPSSGDLDGNIPGSLSNPFALFDFDYSGVKDTDGNPQLSDLAALESGSPGVFSFSNILRFGVTNPRGLAAARDATEPFPPPPSPPNPATPATFVQGDGRNMEALAGLRTTNFAVTIGSYSMNTTFDSAYTNTVTKVGTVASAAQSKFTIAEAQFATVAGQRDEVSGVSLDEEFTKLIQAQRAFQASARMIRTAQEIMEQLVSLI